MRGSERGQAVVMAALLLPVFLMVSTGVIELGNVYSQSLAMARAVDSAAKALADLASSADLTSPSPPPWMQQAAVNLVREALGDQAALDGAQVSWGSTPRIINNVGGGLRVEVPLPQFGVDSTTLRWGDSHSFAYQAPSHDTAWRSTGFQPGVGYGESATYPGWQWANLTNWHWYADNSVYEWGEQGVGGSGFGWGWVWMWVCTKFGCFKIPVYSGPVKVIGTSAINFVYDAWGRDAGRWMGGNYEGAWIPADWASWWGRRTGADYFAHWDRWLREAGWTWRQGQSRSSPGQAQVGPYAVYQGDVTRQADAWPSNPNTIRRTLVVSASGRFRAVTPFIGYLFQGRLYTRTASHDVERRM